MELRKFKAKPFIQQNLQPAKQLLEYSRKISPLQPTVHLRLAQLNSIIGDTKDADLCIERTVAITPQSPKFRNLAGIYYLQSNRPKLAAEQFRHQLELQPRSFRRVLAITTGRSNRAIEPLSAEIISDIMLPEAPLMMYQFSSNRIVSPDQKRSLLERAAKILDDLEFRRTDEENKILGDIRNQQGELEKACLLYTSPSPRDRG